MLINKTAPYKFDRHHYFRAGARGARAGDRLSAVKQWCAAYRLTGWRLHWVLEGFKAERELVRTSGAFARSGRPLGRG